MTIHLVISLPKAPYIHQILGALANPNHNQATPHHSFNPTRHTTLILCHYGWPELWIYTVYDRVSGNSPAKNSVYTLILCHHTHTVPLWLARTTLILCHYSFGQDCEYTLCMTVYLGISLPKLAYIHSYCATTLILCHYGWPEPHS